MITSQLHPEISYDLDEPASLRDCGLMSNRSSSDICELSNNFPCDINTDYRHITEPGRCVPLITRSLIKILIYLLLTGCQGVGTGQRNLNKSLGWESSSPDNYTVLFVKLNSVSLDSIALSHKKEVDEKLIKMLLDKDLGNQVENDEQSETDLHFAVPKNYDKALRLILSVVKDFDLQDSVTIWRREYDSLGKWTDQAILRN